MYKVAIIGCGMMGREHIQSLVHIPDITISHLCDPNDDSLRLANEILREEPLVIVSSEAELHAKHRHEFDIVVIASPNHLHTDSILLWGVHDHLSILVEKPVAVNVEQLQRLEDNRATLKANIWVGMEYRYIKPITMLREHIRSVGTIQHITIRENRYPFLEKVGGWNRHASQTGDTFVEKCCHFFDLFFMLASNGNVIRCKSMAKRNVRKSTDVIDSGNVLLELENGIQCSLELCMFAEGSRHQEEITVTGTEGRLEAYLPEMTFYKYIRPDDTQWTNKLEPPPNVDPQIFHLEAAAPHEGYHHGSTYREWLHFIAEVKKTSRFRAAVTLKDGINAVHAGLLATEDATK